MSTKMYDCYIVKNCKSVGELNVLHQKIRNEIVKLQYEAMATVIMDKYTYNYDNKALGNDPEEDFESMFSAKDPLLFLIQKVIKEYGKAFESPNKNHTYNFSCDIVYLQKGDDVVFKVFMEKDKYSEYFSKTYEDYHYQNSGDKPKKISKKDWDERRDYYDSLNGSLRELGITSTLTDLPSEVNKYDQRWTKEVFVKNAPELSKRVLKLAREKRDQEYISRSYPNGTTDREFSFSAWMEYNESPEAIELVSKYEKEIIEKLDSKLVEKIKT